MLVLRKKINKNADTCRYVKHETITLQRSKASVNIYLFEDKFINIKMGQEKISSVCNPLKI
jgi:hypothetical protein